MTRSQIGVFAVWVATVIAMVALVFGALPALARTIFRARLDSIRDQCMNKVLGGVLSTAPPVEEFLASLAVLNRIARQLTLFRTSLIMLSLWRIHADITAYHGVSFASLEPEERKILHALQHRTNDVLARYLVWGSPLGWFLAPLIFLAQRHDRRRRTPLQVHEVARDFTRAGAYNDLAQRPRLIRAA